MEPIYLDYNVSWWRVGSSLSEGQGVLMMKLLRCTQATTPLDPAVQEAMMPYLTGRFGNPSSSHW